MPVHTPVFPLTAHESFSQVSLPNSPGRGMVLNCHSSLPVRTSKARASPLVLLCVLTVSPSLNDDPIEHHVFDDRGGGVQADLAGLEIDRLTAAVRDAFLQIDDAVLAEALNRCTGLGVERATIR